MARTTAAGLSIARASSIYRLLRVLLLGLPRLPFVSAVPLIHIREGPPDMPKSPDDPSLYVMLSTAFVLVVLGGIFAGLTIALMGQDEIYLQVIATSGEGKEREHARKVLKLLKTGKHWILVTLLLSNVITNETLPVILDRSIGGGWPAVLSSTVLIVIFGEVIPQSICVRYGLPIGAWTSKAVLVLMWITAPVAWPIAKLLDYLLGKSHTTTYKKAGLKTLVTLHRTLGTSPDERLNKDEVTIISAVLDLKEKSVGSIMTPIDDVFTLSADAVLDEELMDTILTAGYSRIPIYTPDHPQNFVGMLLVKMLITYDPEDCLRVRDFSLATLPETRPETSCLDIVNFFQEGKSHMVLVSDYPGEPYGALGVVTLEDVIEELIGEEIIDESDVFVDVHKAIRRMNPAPRTRIPKGEIVTALEPGSHTDQDGDTPPEDGDQSPLPKRPSPLGGISDENERNRGKSLSDLARSPTLYLRRRKSADVNETLTVPVASGSAEVLEALKHLGPSNLASAPKSTKINTVHIKPGNRVSSRRENDSSYSSPHFVIAEEAGVESPSLSSTSHRHPSSAGLSASDASKALKQVRQISYGTLTHFPLRNPDPVTKTSGNGKGPAEHEQSDGADHLLQSRAHRSSSNVSSVSGGSGKIIIPSERPPSRQSDGIVTPVESVSSPSGGNGDSPPLRKTPAQTGSITESVVDSGGLKKLVLGLQPAESDNEGGTQGEPSSSEQLKKSTKLRDGAAETASTASIEDKAKPKKRRKKRSGKKKGKDGSSAESQPLLPK